MNKTFHLALATRRQHSSLGWAGAESHVCAHVPSAAVDVRACQRVDDDEKRAKLEGDVKLPRDPMLDAHKSKNLPLLAMFYCCRRFVLCPRWCLICSRVVENVVIRPYGARTSSLAKLTPTVCEAEICRFQSVVENRDGS